MRYNDRDGGRETRRKLADLITDEHIDRALAVLDDALNASQSARQGRDAEGKPNYVLIPDWTIRVTAANLLLQHRHGKPVQRNLMTIDRPEEGETLSKDETIRRLAGSLDHVVEIARVYHEAAHAIDNAKHVDQVIDTERVPDLPDFFEADDNQGDANSSPDST